MLRRAYLKTAIVLELTRPEPYYWLGALCAQEGDTGHAAHYYYVALNVCPTFRPAREALIHLGRMSPER